MQAVQRRRLPARTAHHHQGMPDEDDDRVLKFPGAKAPPGAPDAKVAPKRAPKPTRAASAKSDADDTDDDEEEEDSGTPEATSDLTRLAELDEDRRKAISVILSGMPFVCIGIQPSPTGADFFTSLGGEPIELTRAAPHLPGVLERLFNKRGLT